MNNPGDTTSDADRCCVVKDDVFIPVWQTRIMKSIYPSYQQDRSGRQLWGNNPEMKRQERWTYQL